jgi:molybdenum-dependent DNA-binding transcriptional regulator ModE
VTSATTAQTAANAQYTTEVNALADNYARNPLLPTQVGGSGLSAGAVGQRYISQIAATQAALNKQIADNKKRQKDEDARAARAADENKSWCAIM